MGQVLRTSRCRPRCRRWTKSSAARSTASPSAPAIAAFLLKLTEGASRDHVYTLHAELEGQKLAPIFEQLLAGWQAQGYQLASMADYYQKIQHLPMPVCPITWGELPGRSAR
jgi:hypothetical protein